MRRDCGHGAKLDTRAINNDVIKCSLSRDTGAIEQRLKSQKYGKRNVRIDPAFELKRPVQFRPLTDVYPRVQLVINVRDTRMESYGALAGWNHLDHGSYVMLKLESFRSKDALDERDLDNFRVFLTKQQALLLGNYLIKLSEQSVISRKQKSWLRRRLE